MVVGLSALLAVLGKLIGARRSYAVSTDDRPSITVMIPALNEERTIPYALTSLAMQTVTPERVIVVDDGSTDDTAAIVEELDDEFEIDIELRQHEVPMGKTVGMKEVAGSVNTDTLFVLDADTFLESEDYLEKLIAPHIEGNVASSFGTVYPIDGSAKQVLYDGYVRDALPADGITSAQIRADLEGEASRRGIADYLTGNRPTIGFRNIEYHVQQRFFTDGIVKLFDSTLFPVGCAVLYDREKLVSVFKDYEESHGNDLTNSEDIFVGFAFCNRGWDNVQLANTYMRSSVPGLRGVLRQNYLWGSGFLQSAYYFGRLSRRFRSRRVTTDGGTETASPRADLARGDRTDLHEAIESTDVTEETDGFDLGRPREGMKRPMGWVVLTQLIDGLYPTMVFALLLSSLVGIFAAELAVLIVVVEFTMFVLLALVTRSDRLELPRNLLPFLVIRLITLPVLTYTYLRVGTDIVVGNRNWRK